MTSRRSMPSAPAIAHSHPGPTDGPSDWCEERTAGGGGSGEPPPVCVLSKDAGRSTAWPLIPGSLRPPPPRSSRIVTIELIGRRRHVFASGGVIQRQGAEEVEPTLCIRLEHPRSRSTRSGLRPAPPDPRVRLVTASGKTIAPRSCARPRRRCPVTPSHRHMDASIPHGYKQEAPLPTVSRSRHVAWKARDLAWGEPLRLDRCAQVAGDFWRQRSSGARIPRERTQPDGAAWRCFDLSRFGL